MAVDELGEAVAADLLLPLDQPGHATGQAAVHRPYRVDRGQPGHKLALVVLGTTCVEPPIANRGLEWWAVPELQRFWRLNVVVVVEEHRAVRSGTITVGQHHWVAGTGLDSSLKTAPPQQLCHERG